MNTQPFFFKPTDIGPRQWGREILVAYSEGKYIGKLLKMNAGFKGGLQKHQLKDETGYIYSGEMNFYYDAGDGKLTCKKLTSGDAVHISPGTIHQEEAITDVIIFETSSPHFNDRVRCEGLYGQEIPSGGLPSSTIEEIQTTLEEVGLKLEKI